MQFCYNNSNFLLEKVASLSYDDNMRRPWGDYFATNFLPSLNKAYTYTYHCNEPDITALEPIAKHMFAKRFCHF